MTMKKYLTKGALALVLGGCIAGCAKDEDFSGSIVDNKLQTYEQVFEEEFGTIDSSNDWGFQTIPTRAATRTASTNANQWEDQGYTLPADITSAEVKKVLAVFNQKGAATYTSLVNWDTYFVQQVYKGVAKYYSHAAYNADGSLIAGSAQVTGSEHMDWLCSVVNGVDDHINNFNNGNCITTATSEKTGATIKNMMLMVNSATNKFGFKSSEDNGHVFYNFRMEVIDGNYYVGFDFEADGINPNEKIDRDYIYNDWIVKIVPGVGTTPPTPDETSIPLDNYESKTAKIPVYWRTSVTKTASLIDFGRVFCEDLGQISRSDIDFNDAVFDVYLYEEVETTAKYEVANGVEVEGSRTETSTKPTRYASLVVLAAGGTIPLSIAGKEIHSLFGVGTGTIVNTALDADGAYFNDYNEEPLGPIFIDRVDGINAIGDIDIFVQFSTEALKLEAKAGKAPHKFCVPQKIPWALERKKFADAYKSFGSYVKQGKKFWTGERDATLLHDIEYTSLPSKIELPGTTTTETEAHRYIDGETTTTGGYNGENVLIRVRN